MIDRETAIELIMEGMYPPEKVYKQRATIRMYAETTLDNLIKAGVLVDDEVDPDDPMTCARCSVWQFCPRHQAQRQERRDR